MRRARMEQYDKEVAAPTSCCYCIIPWPCPSGMNPRTPQVTHLFDGKYLVTLGFTFNQLSHVLRTYGNCWHVPLSLIDTNHTCKGKSYSEHVGSCVACFLATVCYGISLPRGPLRRLSTSPSGTQTACALGKNKTSYGGALSLRLNERCYHNNLGHLSAVRLKQIYIYIWINCQE
jgi:hypothetical protein